MRPSGLHVGECEEDGQHEGGEERRRDSRTVQPDPQCLLQPKDRLLGQAHLSGGLGHGLQPLAQHGGQLLVGAVDGSELDGVRGQLLQLVSVDQHGHLGVVEGVENERVLLLILIQVLNKVERELRPVRDRIEVVDDVVAVVEGEHVERRRDEVDREPIIREGLLRVDELVLSEVSHHEHAGSEGGREAERDPESGRMGRVQQLEGGEVAPHRRH
mmetsp:Transcript_1402/g.4492  ORF Transcript_1402/g.4492 Transcript_1402/m.4492 type:complete len:215 (-) Transcript_1402:803-1447(-)